MISHFVVSICYYSPVSHFCSQVKIIASVCLKKYKRNEFEVSVDL